MGADLPTRPRNMQSNGLRIANNEYRLLVGINKLAASTGASAGSPLNRNKDSDEFLSLDNVSPLIQNEIGLLTVEENQNQEVLSL